MKSSSAETQDFDYLKVLHIIFFTVMMVSCMINSSLAQAASVIPSDYRLAKASDKFSGTVQFAVAFDLRPPRRLRAKRMELVVGTIANRALSFRVQHISNGGLSSTNPGTK